MAEALLSPAEARLLGRLRLRPARAFPGRVRGERLTRKAGLSIEFADYREYAEGDDLRGLDWNVLARLDAPIMKTFRDEEDLAVHLLVDVSASMGFGEPSKLGSAVKLAAFLAYAGLSGGDAVHPAALGGAPAQARALRGRAGWGRFSAWAGGLEPEGKVGLAAGLRAFAASRARAGLCIVLSDGLDPDAPEALRSLAARGHELAFVQLASPLDLRPDLEGDLRLIDAESGQAVEITANSSTLQEYHARFQEHRRRLEAETLKGGGRYALADTSAPPSDLLRDIFVRGGWLAA